MNSIVSPQSGRYGQVLHAHIIVINVGNVIQIAVAVAAVRWRYCYVVHIINLV